MPRHFLRDDDLTPGRAARPGARPGRPGQGRPVRATPAGRPAAGRGDLRQAVPAHPGLVRGRHRRAGRPPAGHRRAGTHFGRGETIEDAARVLSRLRARDRLAHLRPGPDRQAAGRRRRRAGGQRADRRLPPLPAAGRPADRPRAARRLAGRHPGLRRRRGQQHGPLLPAGRRDRRHARAGRRRRRATTPTRPSSPGPPRSPPAPAARSSVTARPGRGGRAAPTWWPPTPGRRWARRTTAPDRTSPVPAVPGQRRAARRRPRPARSCCTACPPPRRGDHRRGDRRPAAARSATRPRTGCTRRRRC